MRKSIVFIISVLLIVLCVGSVFCDYTTPLPDKTTFIWVEPDGSASVVSEQQMNDNLCRMLGEPTAAEWRAQQANKGQGTASAQPATTAAPDNSTASVPSVPKEKVAVSFTDENGSFIGSTQVTKGTDVPVSQFPSKVPECNGKTFDSWDYNGFKLMHDWIIRAKYK